MVRLREKPAHHGSESVGQPYTVGDMRQNLGLILRWRLKLRYFLDSESLIIAGFWSFWLFMGGILIWLVGYCWYWGLVPSLS